MKRLSILVVALLVALLVVGSIVSCGPKEEEPIIIRFGASPMGESIAKMEEMVDDFNQGAEGKVIIERHNREELVSLAECVTALETGYVEMLSFPLGPMASVDARLGFSEIPLLFSNHDAHEYTYSHGMMDLYNEVLGEYNQKLLSLQLVASIDPASNKQIKVLEDWKGQIFQSISPPTAQALELLGASPASVPYNEAYDALDKGVVDGTINSSTYFMIPMGIYEVCEYVTLANLWLPDSSFCINLDTWNSLDEDIQDLLLEESKGYEDYVNQRVRELDGNAQALLEEKGMTVYVLPKEERDRWAQVLQPLREELLAPMGEWAQRAIKVVDEGNAQYP